ncbi:hypothetical protein FGRMN_4363 [Fusarium graminum]|nr:hypothetical protein FGRMN_4363 [Fusarium graminum]
MSWFGRLPQIYFNSNVDSLLHKSIDALANASYGQRFNSDQKLRDATKLYGEAIHMLKDRMLYIVDSSQYVEVMASIILLGIYEGLVDKSVALEGSWVSHTSGAWTLLFLRGQSKVVESHAEYVVSIITLMQMIQIGLLTGQGLAMPWESVKELGLPRLPFFYSHAELIYKSACLCMEWRTALMNFGGDGSVKQLFTIASQALTLDKQLEDWAETLLPSFHYTVEAISPNAQLKCLRPLLHGSWSPLNSHMYPSIMIQIVWRFYWMVRTILNQALLFTHNLFERTKATTNPICTYKAKVESNILSFTDLLCESCLSNFLYIFKKDPQQFRAEAIPSLLGYTTLHVLPTLLLCYEQVKLTDIDLSGRREWAFGMKKFLQENLGIAKGATALPPSPDSNIPIQIWGLP